MEKLPRDLTEFVGLLSEKGVEFLIVGGYAVDFYGYTRYTQDFDFFYRTSQENVARLVSALRDFGFGESLLTEEQLLKAEGVFVLGNPPNRIDLLPTISGVSFQEAWNSKRLGALGECAVYYIGLDELIKNKRASGRTKDILDVHELETKLPERP